MDTSLVAEWATLVKGPLTDLFEPLLGKIYSHITSSFSVTSELFS